jgi:hypothetical protein
MRAVPTQRHHRRRIESNGQSVTQPRGIAMIDADLLNEAIKANIQSLCRNFYPNGSQNCGEWKIADPSGAPGCSLGIQLIGPKAGLCHDRATGYGANFIKLLMANRNISFREAVAEVERYLGISLRTRDAVSLRKPERSICTRSTEKQSYPKAPFVLSRHDMGRMAAAAQRMGDHRRGSLQRGSPHLRFCDKGRWQFLALSQP